MAWVTLPDSDVDPESPITTGLMVALRDNPIAIAGRLSGAPLVTADEVYDQNAGGPPKLRVVNIENWNMHTSGGGGTLSKNITHGLTQANIRSVRALIRNDAATLLYMDGGASLDTGVGEPQFWIQSIDSNTVNLTRLTGGRMDNADHDDGSFTRGWLYIWYVDP